MSLDSRFEIGAAVHIGQIATAYEAIQRGLDRKVLLKVIHPQWKNDPELLERFSREGKAAARVSHHNVVKIFDIGHEDDLPFIVLEWIDGGTLAERLKDGPLPQAEVRKMAVELLRGLSAVHDAHLLHRDIKPDNIMFASDGEARLTDFSLAGLGHVSSLTGHDGIVGSPAYLAPELLAGSPPDVRTDLYSLGVVLLEGLTGSNPFKASDPMISIGYVQNKQPPKLSGRPRLDPSLAALIDALLAKDVSLRPSNAAAALRFLNGGHADTVVEVISTNEKKSNTQWRPAILLAASLTAMLILFNSGDYQKYQAPQVRIPHIVSQIEDQVPVSASRTGEKPQFEPIAQKQPKVIEEPTQITPVKPGAIVMQVYPWGELTVDGRVVGTTPLEPLELAPGKHTLEIAHPSFPRVVREVSINPGGVDTIRLDLRRESAMVLIMANPWGYLWIDGDSLGLLPRMDPVWLAGGAHNMTISHPEFDTWSRTVEVRAGEKTKFSVDLANGTLIATPFPEGTSESRR